MPRVSQANYDQLVEGFLNDGLGFEEAIGEAIACLVGHDLSAVFQYSNARELEFKTKVDTYCKTIEQLVHGQQSAVNVIFCLQGLFRNLTPPPGSGPEGEVVRLGTLRLLEHRDIFKALMQILHNLTINDEEEEQDQKSNGEGSDDDDDNDDENKLLQKENVLQFLNFMIAYSSSDFTSYEQCFGLSEEEIVGICYILDADSSEARIMDPMCDLVGKLLRVESNRALFRASTILRELDLIKKLLKNNRIVQSKADAIINMLN
jgi:hypothetical protein